MAQEDALTLAARIKDEFSGPVAAMSKGWKTFSDQLKHGHEEGVKHARLHKREVEGLSEKFDEMRRGVLEGVAPALEELGISMFTVGGSIAGIVSNLKGAAEQFNVFRDASVRAHTSVDVLQSMARTISDLTGEGTAQVVQDLGAVGEQLDKITRGRFDTVNAFKHAYTGLWETLGQQLKGETPAQALETTMEFFDKNPGIAVDKRREILRLIGFDARLATVDLRELHEEEAKNERWRLQHPYDFETIRKLDTAFHDLGRSVDSFGWTMTKVFGSDGAALIEKFAGYITNLGKEIEAIKQVWDATAIPWWLGGSGVGKAVPGSPFQPLPQIGTMQHPFPEPPADKFSPASRLAGGYRPIGFTNGSEAENVFTRSIHSGTLAALQDWYAALSGKHDGITPASYGPSGSAGGGRGWGGGGGYSVLEGGGAHPAPGGAGNRAGGGGAGRGVPSGSGPAPGGVSGNARDTAKIVADEWSRAGMSREGIAGLMANIKDESNFDPALRHPDQPKFGGEAHFAHGLYQEGGTEWNHYKAWLDQNYPGEDWRDPRLQSRFAAENLKKNYPGTWSKMLHGDRFHAAAAYVGEYLKPAEQYRQGRMNKYLHGGVGELERYTGPRDLLSQPAAPVMGGGTHKVEGDAHLKVDLNGFPKGTRTDLTYGGLFTQYTLARGRQMEESERQ